jgi:light-independent protochlorophyllide reductase subunit B
MLVEERIAALQPELVLGTQMERHTAKRLGLPCAVISAPVHVQDYPARYSPQMGFEGANVLFDTWVHPLMMGLEEHLLTMFRGDFEFHDAAPASHLGRSAPAAMLATPRHAAEAVDAPEPSAMDSHQAAALDLPVAAEPIAVSSAAPLAAMAEGAASWADDAQAELKKIPFFVRGKARRNTERFALERGVSLITVETLYDAKSHFGR